MAATEGKVNVMQKLLQKGANPNALCGTYGAVINAAIESGNCDAVRILVEKNVSLTGKGVCGKMGDGSDDVDHQGETQAGENGGEHGVDESQPATEGGEADEGDEEAEGNEAEVEKQGEGELEEEEEEEEVIRSPLAVAALLSDLTMLEFLLENYSEELPPEEFGAALVEATKGGRLEAFKGLFTSFEHSQNAFKTAVDKAASEGNWDIVGLLLEGCQDLCCSPAFLGTARGHDGR
ncbi:hypothetical protein ACJ41O_012330 [Fusarium nematophilum]